jgi:hypothetical protein
MKSNLLAKTLGIIVVATMGLTAPAQANDWRDDDRNHEYSDRDSDRDEDRDAELIQKLREGFRFSRLIDNRQGQQLDRIMASVEADRLSKSKFIQLMQEQKSIRAMESRFMDDQYLTEREYQRLNQSLDVAQRNIQVASRNYNR